ncbi:MAG: hypothetical protein ACYS76_15765 [Planctomycetota bacterium]
MAGQEDEKKPEKDKRAGGWRWWVGIILIGAAAVLVLLGISDRLATVFACVVSGIAPLVITYIVGWIILPKGKPQEQ